MPEITWKHQGHAIEGRIGRWHIFSVIADLKREKGEDMRYVLTCRLPGIKKRFYGFRSEQAAQDAAMPIYNYWKDGIDE